MAAFTMEALGKLKPKDKRFEIKDPTTKGLVLRVTPTGSKSWYWSRFCGGRHERVRIGLFADVTLKTAREIATKHNGTVAEGVNPAEIRRRARAQMTLGELWADFLPGIKVRKKSWKTDEWQYTKHLKSQLGGRRLHEISTTLVSRRAGSIRRNGGPIAANRVLALLSSMWEWARRERGLDLPNPCKGVQRFDEVARERYLLPDELKRFYTALMADPNEDTRDLLLMLLFTAQRKSVITALRWAEVDLTDSVLRIPGERMKSGRGHIIPLTGLALQTIKARAKEAKKSAGFVFPSRSKAGHIVDLRPALARVMKAAKIEGRFTPHDLRRTWATYCREMGRDPAPILGHAPVGVTEKHYAMATLSALRESARVTVEHMLTIATASTAGKVVKFPQAGGA